MNHPNHSTQEDLDQEVNQLREINRKFDSLIANFEGLSIDEKAKLIESLRAQPVKPRSWGKNSVAPYYKEIYGEWLIPYLDRLIEEKNVREQSVFFSAKKHKLSVASLRLKVEQAFQYVIDYMDTPEKKYFELKCDTKLTKFHGEGLKLQWRQFIGNAEDTILTDERKKKWMRELDIFVETAKDGEGYKRAGISVSPIERDKVRDMFSQSDSFAILELDETRINVVKLDKELLNKLNKQESLAAPSVIQEEEIAVKAEDDPFK